MGNPSATRFPTIDECDISSSVDRRSIAADLEGTLLISSSSFPYFMLVAIEAGSFFRGLILLLSFPIISSISYIFVFEALAIRLMIYISFSGLKSRDIELVSRAVLPRFYASDVRAESYEVLDKCKRKVIVTENPTIMAEYFCKDYLGADKVIGTEIEVDPKTKRATGFVKKPGVIVSKLKKLAVLKEFGEEIPDIGIGDRESDHDFMSVCKEGFMVPQSKSSQPIPLKRLKNRLIFQDGRLVQRPTPLNALITYIWLPFGFALSLIRVYFRHILPERVLRVMCPMVGINLVMKGNPPPAPSVGSTSSTLYVCNHRTSFDPIFVAVALGRKVSCVSYGISKLTRFFSPIPVVALTRDREGDAAKIKALLENGDLVVCPEGTTCREDYLLRFSSLFAELSDRVVPVAINIKQNMFYGTTARGVKFWDTCFFLMNPRPMYEITFLEKLSEEMTCKAGKSSIEVANHVQKILADALGFECTQFTRKHKYMLLVGNDGKVESMCSKNI